MVSTRAGHTYSAPSVMDEAALRKVISDAISDLPDKSYIAELVEKLEVKINETIQVEIQKVIAPLNNKITTLERKIDVYEAHFAGIEKRLAEAEFRIDEAEQYSRRACLRIYGIPLPPSGNESAESCISKVKEVFKEIEVDVPDHGIDRAHRIGKKYTRNGKMEQAMIVKFVSWQDRTAVYKARKKLDDKAIQLDLTARRSRLLKYAKDKVEGNEDIDFVFPDINCRLGLKTTDGKFFFYSDESELEAVLDDLE